MVFTEYAHTVEWLERVLTQHGYGDRLAVIEGSTPTEDREYIRSQFTADPAEETVRVLLATDAAGEGIDLQTLLPPPGQLRHPVQPVPAGAAHRPHRPLRADRGARRSIHFMPDTTSSTYGADADFMGRIARKVAQVEHDLGSVNQVIGEEIQQHFARRAPAKRKSQGRRRQRGDQHRPRRRHGAQRPAHPARAGLRRLALRAAPGAGQPAPGRRHRAADQPPTAIDSDRRRPHRRRGVPDADADRRAGRTPSRAWTPASSPVCCARSPSTRLPPKAAAIWSTSTSATRSCRKPQRLLRSSLWSVDSPLNRVTAVVVDGLPESFVAAVTRMVLVGRGGLRLHEDVFLVGVRLKGRRAMAEEKAEAALDQALDGDELQPRRTSTSAPGAVRHVERARMHRCAPGCEESMESRAARRHELVVEQLAKRQDARHPTRA